MLQFLCSERNLFRTISWPCDTVNVDQCEIRWGQIFCSLDSPPEQWRMVPPSPPKALHPSKSLVLCDDGFVYHFSYDSGSIESIVQVHSGLVPSEFLLGKSRQTIPCF
jgi:hypothetical protein